jgi:ribulose-phosphate 3-epimerase
VTDLEGVLEAADLVLVMSVEPGFGGQKWMEETLAKPRWLKERGYRGVVAMDGGIDETNAAAVAAAGVDALVAGSAVFGREDRGGAVAAIRAEAEAGHARRPAGWPGR